MLDITNEQYHARPEISKSDLDLINDAPKKFKNKHLYKDLNNGYDFGSVAHAMILENSKFDDFVRVSDMKTRTSQKFQQFRKDNAGFECLTSNEFEDVKPVIEAVRDHPVAMALLYDGVVEKSITSEIDGVKTRCRFDAYSKIGSRKVLVDLKTTVDADYRKWVKKAADFRYHVQDAYYTDNMRNEGYQVDDFIFIVVSHKTYEVGIYNLDHVAKDYGREAYMKNLQTLKWCRENDTYPLYEDFSDGEVKPIRTVTLPNYVYYQ